MKKLLMLISVLFMTACSDSSKPYDSIQRIHKDTLTHKAYYWYGLNEKDNRYLIKQITGVDPVTTEWCAAFVNMVLLENNLPRSSSVSKYPLMARSFLFWGNKVVGDPQQGDILIFKRGDQGWQGHVGFYVSHKVVDNETIYYVLGGNQDNQVSVAPYKGSDLLDIRRYSPILAVY